jgi:hypothetical protein
MHTYGTARRDVSNSRMLKRVHQLDTKICSDVGDVNRPSSVHKSNCETICRMVYLAVSTSASDNKVHTRLLSDWSWGLPLWFMLLVLEVTGNRAFIRSSSRALMLL